ncbi:archaetidylserine decarboxylase [Halochromatium salexigens]|uniref:archaetidylserine decarboxylase n=1 Tax=Halochromatium salexigens TaxID=49447 RepID=UPI00191255CB|nr:archaetidylserine decarboxylase [Halochromatium salexigens]
MPESPATDSTQRTGIGARLFVLLQYGLPQHALSNAMHWLTQRRLPGLLPWVVQLYARLFRVALEEAEEPDPRAYPTFNAFFTRALRPGVRPLPEAADAIACPVDGRVSAVGAIRAEQLLQAKGQRYRLDHLLGGDGALAARFRDGRFATLYLSPRDYHRIHMPLGGALVRTIQVPGRLFSVNPTTVAGVPRLFARNERVVCLFETAAGPMAVVLVGAIFVGSIETVWAGRMTPPRIKAVTVTEAGSGPIRLARGDELGRFNMGSTVILLFGAEAVTWASALIPGAQVRAGSAIGQIQ